MKKVRGFNLDEENLKYLEKKAKEQDRSTSNLLNHIIKERRTNEEININ